jgi:glycerol-3-phosphate dehydrogenase
MAPALMANDLLSRDRNAGVVTSAQLPRGGLIRGKKCRDLVAPLVNIKPAAGAMWWDAIALDTAALTLAPLRAAVEAGAVVVSGVEARGLRVHGRTVRSVVVRDELIEGATPGVLGVRGDVDLQARVVVDATGPWAGRLAARAGLSPSAYLPKGWVGALNLVLNRSLGLEAAVALAAASRPAAASAFVGRKSRELFFVPWNGVTMIGTDYFAIESTVGGFAPEHSAPPADAVERFIAEINRVAPRAHVRLDDVAHVHWGVLPGEAPDSVVPRKSPVVAGGRRMTGAAGLVVAIGEKLTSAPVVAERVLRCIKVAAAEAQRARRTGRRRSRGGGSGGSGGYSSR